MVSRISASFENGRVIHATLPAICPVCLEVFVRLALSAILRLKRSSLVFLAPVCSTMGTLVANHSGRSFVLPIGNTNRQDVAESNIMAIRPEIGKIAVLLYYNFYSMNPLCRIALFALPPEDDAFVLGPLGSRTSFCTRAAGWGNVEASPVLEILLQI